MSQIRTWPKTLQAASRSLDRMLGGVSWGEEGQGMVEYALIILLIALALIASLSGYQSALSSAFAWITDSIASTIS